MSKEKKHASVETITLESVNNGNYALKTNDGYLTCAASGANLTTTFTPDDSKAQWTVDANNDKFRADTFF